MSARTKHWGAAGLVSSCVVLAAPSVGAQPRELDDVDTIAAQILAVAPELGRGRFAVLPDDEPFMARGRAVCSPMWQLAFSLERHMARRSLGAVGDDEWQRWVAASEGLDALGDASSGTFLTQVRQQFRARYTVTIELVGSDPSTAIDVVTADGNGETVRQFRLPLPRPFRRADLPVSEDRCLSDDQRAESLEAIVDELLRIPAVRARMGRDMAIWFQPGTLRDEVPQECVGAYGATVHAESVDFSAGPMGSIREVREIVDDVQRAGQELLERTSSFATVLVVRRVNESPDGVMISAELWSRQGLVGHTLNRTIGRENWAAIIARRRCPTARVSLPSSLLESQSSPGQIGIDYHEHPRSWVLYLQGHVGGALRTVEGEDGHTAGGGSLRVDVAPTTDDALVHLGAAVGFSSDSVGWAQALATLRAGSFFRAGLGAGATASLNGGFELTDGMVSAHAVILAPIFPGVRSAGGLLAVEAFKGFTTPLAYLTISLGLWFGRP